MSARRALVWIISGLILLCVCVAVASAVSNLFFPGRSQVTDRLTELDKARASEAQHLRRALGQNLWPGWGESSIPLILYNEEYAFLIGYPDPPPGWIKMPQNLPRGGPWEPVPGDTFEGQTYYRQRLSEGITPEAFTDLVGSRWVASLATRPWFQVALGDQLRKDFGPVVPYRLAGRFLAGSTDKYITLILHESFHAFQGMTAPERLTAAERAVADEKRYPWSEERLRAAWQREMNLLADAVSQQDSGEVRRLAREFLAQRTARRAESVPAPLLQEIEKQREWLEGLAKYTELRLWQQAAGASSYRPLPLLTGDGDFHNYAGWEESWSQEVNQIKLSGNNLDDVSFYYSGMAQAVLLDRLSPDWRGHILQQGLSLEDLLRRAVEQ